MDEKIDCREQEAHETALPPAATWNYRNRDGLITRCFVLFFLFIMVVGVCAVKHHSIIDTPFLRFFT